MNPDIFVVIEHLRGQVSDLSYVMLAAARELANATGGKVIAVLLGHDANRWRAIWRRIACCTSNTRRSPIFRPMPTSTRSQM
jgi:hypothetical protein